MIAPVNADGLICGYSPTVEVYPSLYIDDITAALTDPTKAWTSSVCVKSCPSSAADPIDCVNTTYSATIGC